jgi:hypothetical protein
MVPSSQNLRGAPAPRGHIVVRFAVGLTVNAHRRELCCPADCIQTKREKRKEASISEAASRIKFAVRFPVFSFLFSIFWRNGGCGLDTTNWGISA